MKKNMSITDQLIRLMIASVIALLYFFGTVSGAAGTALMVVAVILLITSFVSFCPLYAMLHITSRKAGRKSAEEDKKETRW